MFTEKSKFTRLTLDQSDLHLVWEIPYEDVTGQDMMQAIRTLMIGMTFTENTIERSMANYLQDHSDEYEVYEKSEQEKEDEGLDVGIPSPEEYENSKIETKPHFYA